MMPKKRTVLNVTTVTLLNFVNFLRRDKNYYMGLVIRTDKAVQEEFDGIVKELAEKSQGKFSLQNCIQELHRKRQGTSHSREQQL